MLEGGNEQLQKFYTRHDMGEKSKVFDQRYQTKAARFYRKNMERHVAEIEKNGEWRGRAASRNVTPKPRNVTLKPTKQIQENRQVAVAAQ